MTFLRLSIFSFLCQLVAAGELCFKLLQRPCRLVFVLSIVRTRAFSVITLFRIKGENEEFCALPFTFYFSLTDGINTKCFYVLNLKGQILPFVRRDEMRWTTLYFGIPDLHWKISKLVFNDIWPENDITLSECRVRLFLHIYIPTGAIFTSLACVALFPVVGSLIK